MRVLIIVTCTLLTFSCATQKKQPKSIKGITEISFGKSGGFTGFADEYVITASAEVFKISDSVRTKINQITKPEIRDISKQISDLQFKDIKLSETGNMTYFIEVSANKYKNRITWSDITDNPQIKELYKILVKTLTPE
jgi:hypothetical protein